MLECPECKSTQLVKSGKAWRNRIKVQRYRCLKCGRVFTEPKSK
jgi:transposase-like protein